jgi:DNA-binding LytR/AlgR family response regulator
MIKCIIVDDEPLAIQLLENHISKISTLKLVAKAKNAMEAYFVLQSQPVDLMFLDIEMPNLNGLDFLKSLSHRPKTIFTTAHRDFAIEGFELEAVDYILKPITFTRFFKSVERVLRRNSPSIEDEFIIIRSEGLNRKILLNDIIYLESSGNDIKVMLKGDKCISGKDKISVMESMLADKGFVRIHRSFMINPRFLTAFSNTQILLGIHAIHVGRNYKKQFDECISIIEAKRLL